MVVDIDALSSPLWEQLADQRSTSVFQSPPWLRVLATTYGFPIRARVLIDKLGSPQAGFAYAELKDFLGYRLVSLPFSDFCDAIATDGDEWGRLIDRLLALNLPITLRCLHNVIPLRDHRFAPVGRARWHAIDLKREEGEIWESLHGAARRAVRKSRADGVTVKVGRGERDLRAFYELHMGVRKHKYRLLAQPYAFFRSIWEEFLVPGQGALLLAVRDGRAIAGCLFLEWRGTFYYKLNASDPGSLPSRPNDAVLWAGITLARERGLDHLDFGVTDWNQDGLVQYKRKYATEERTISFLRYEPPGFADPRSDEAREVLREVTRLLVDEAVPDQVSERAGAVLYRYFT